MTHEWLIFDLHNLIILQKEYLTKFIHLRLSFLFKTCRFYLKHLALKKYHGPLPERCVFNLPCHFSPHPHIMLKTIKPARTRETKRSGAGTRWCSLGVVNGYRITILMISNSRKHINCAYTWPIHIIWVSFTTWKKQKKQSG